MARPRQAVENIKSAALYESMGLRVCRYAVALDEEIIDTVEARKHLTETDVHDIRVNLKRLRAMRQLTYFETVYPHFRAADANLRDAGRLLSGDRDQTVLRKTLKKLFNGVETEKERQKVKTVLFHLGKKNKGKGLTDESVKHRVKDYVLSDQQDWRKFQKGLTQTHNLLTGLARTYGYARSLARRVSRNDIPTLSHRWRKWCKYLYYELLFLSQLSPNSTAKSNRESDLKRLGNVLGWRHDIEALNEVLNQTSKLGSIKEEAMLVKALARDWDIELKQESEFLSNRLFAHKPIEFAESILSDDRPDYPN